MAFFVMCTIRRFLLYFLELPVVEEMAAPADMLICDSYAEHQTVAASPDEADIQVKGMQALLADET